MTTILNSLSSFFLSEGQRKRIEEVLSEERELAERSQQVNMRLRYMGGVATLAVIDGRLEEAVDIVHKIQTISSEMALTEFARVVIVNRPGRALLNLGKAEEALRNAEGLPEPTSSRTQMRRAVCLAHLGRNKEVTDILDRLVLANHASASTEDASIYDTDIGLLEAATITGHREAISLLLQLIGQGSILPFGWSILICSFRILGAASAFLGKHEEARGDYHEALRVCAEMRFRPEIALTRLGLAELLLEHYPKEKKEALEHLDFAIKEFREMKMQPSLERALRHKEILKA